MFCAQRVRVTRKGKPGEKALSSRNLDGGEPRYYLSNAAGHHVGDSGLRGRFQVAH